MGLVCITSDHHYDAYKQFSTVLSTGVNSRLAEMLAVEDWLHEEMVRRSVNVHFRLGDLFDKKNTIDAVTYIEVASRIRKNVESGIREIIFVGNHDIAIGGIRNTLEDLEASTGATIVSSPVDLLIEDHVWRCIPHNENITEMEQAFRFLSKMASMNLTHILLSHVGVHGARSGSEFVLPGYFSIDSLEWERYRWTFLGHVHEPQFFNGTNVSYVGSFVQRNFSDVGSQRRAIFYKTDTEIPLSIPLPGPQFVAVSFSSLDEVEQYVVDDNTYYKITIANHSIQPRIVNDRFCSSRGWTLTFIDSSAQRVPERPQLKLTTWEDVCGSYITQKSPDADRGRLLDAAKQCITQSRSPLSE